MPTPTNKRTVFMKSANLAVVRKRFDKSGNEAAEGEERVILSGRAIVYGPLSDDRGGFRVRLLPGSAHFATPTHALYHHDYRAVIGNTENATLRITPDDAGVNVEVTLPDTQTARDVAELVEDRYVTGMSFSMLMDDVFSAEEKTEGDLTILEVSSFTCDEVTITAIPSFADTSISVRATADQSIDPPAQLSRAPERIAQAMKLEQLRLDAYSL